MTEHDLRLRVYELNLKPNTKLTLLGVMCFVKWDTWSGPCSAKDVSKKMAMNERAVKRALKELTDIGMIKRSAQRRSANNHHRAVTEVNVSLIMRGVTMSPPSDNKTLPPSDIMTPNTTEDNNRGYNRETTEDTQQTSQPAQDAETSVAVVAVEEDDSSLPPELSHLTDLQLDIVRERAADKKCSLLEAYEQLLSAQRNREKKLEWRYKNERKYSQPTTAYRPKPLY